MMKMKIVTFRIRKIRALNTGYALTQANALTPLIMMNRPYHARQYWKKVGTHPAKSQVQNDLQARSSS